MRSDLKFKWRSCHLTFLKFVKFLKASWNTIRIMLLGCTSVQAVASVYSNTVARRINDGWRHWLWLSAATMKYWYHSVQGRSQEFHLREEFSMGGMDKRATSERGWTKLFGIFALKWCVLVHTWLHFDSTYLIEFVSPISGAVWTRKTAP